VDIPVSSSKERDNRKDPRDRSRLPAPVASGNTNAAGKEGYGRAKRPQTARQANAAPLPPRSPAVPPPSSIVSACSRLRKHTESLDAYDLTLRGLHLLYRLDYDAFSQARGYLQQAIVSDPDYAAPHAYAAHWHVFRVGQGWSPDPQSDALEGRRLAAAAIDLDKHNALALAINGHMHSFILKQTDVALGYFERALGASPNCAMAWALSSATSSYLGNGVDAVARAEYALRLSPRDIHAFYYQTALTLAHYASGDYEAAARSGLKAVSQNPGFCTNLRHTAASLVALGRLREAHDIARMHIRAQPRFTLASFAPSCPYQSDDKRVLFLERLREAGLPN
jgi:adenylate cyclase